MIAPKQIYLIIEDVIKDWSIRSDYNTIDFYLFQLYFLIK